jgi:uncharacterized protein
MRTLRVIAAVVLLGAVAAFIGVGRPEGANSAAGPTPGTITVNGSGSVTAVPNRASFSFGVTTQGKSASAALAANSVDIRKVIAALRSAGIAGPDIQTQSVSLSPRTSQDGETILGYTASNTVSATAKDINRAGAVVDAAVQAGANQVFGPTLTRSDANSLYQRALRAAIANARAKALTIASASHARLGRVRSVVEGSSSPIPFAAAAPKVANDSTPIEPGTQETDASVTVEFALL